MLWTSEGNEKERTGKNTTMPDIGDGKRAAWRTKLKRTAAEAQKKEANAYEGKGSNEGVGLEAKSENSIPPEEKAARPARGARSAIQSSSEQTFRGLKKNSAEGNVIVTIPRKGKPYWLRLFAHRVIPDVFGKKESK